VQQWYADASFSGFSFNYGGTAGASTLTHLYLTPLLQLKLKTLKKKGKMEKRPKMTSESS
jgi:hypothetical protein